MTAPESPFLPTPPPDGEPPPQSLLRIPEERWVDLDVRPVLREGREPFSLIMKAREELSGGGGLLLRVPFEPVPLYRVMRRAGFRSWAQKDGPKDWRIWFWRDGKEESAETPATQPPSSSGTPGHDSQPGSGSNTIVLDVRGLEPPQPMIRTLEALDELPEGVALIQVNERIPRFLLPELEKRGFRHAILDETPGQVRVRIERG